MFRLKNGKRVLPALVAVAAFSFVAACSGDSGDNKPEDTAKPSTSDAPSEEPKKDGRPLVVWAGAGTPIKANFNPYSTGIIQGTQGLIYEPLFYYNKASATAPSVKALSGTTDLTSPLMTLCTHTPTTQQSLLT